MITIKNNKKATIHVLGKDLGPFESVKVSRETWAKEYADRKPLRDAVAGGYVLVLSEQHSKKTNKESSK